MHPSLMGDAPKAPLLRPVAGDIVVTKVVDHYHVGRVSTDENVITAIGVRNDRAEALALACELVTGRERVIMYYQAGSLARIEIQCPKRTG